VVLAHTERPLPGSTGDRDRRAPSRNRAADLRAHEIVHNRHVVERWRAKGAAIRHELDEVPPGSVTIFSAHGVATRSRRRPADRGCRSHRRTARWFQGATARARLRHQGREIVLIGHAGHPRSKEREATSPGASIHIQGRPRSPSSRSPTRQAGFITQTTLSVDDTRSR